MDLHRTTFKMESTSYLPNPLASPTLMVLASTAEASRDASIPCQPSRPFGIPISMDKDAHSYTFASMYHRPASVPSGFPSRDFPHSLLHLHPQFAPSALDCSPIGMLSHGAVGAFRPFEDRDGGGYQSAFTPAKRLKVCLEAETSPHLRYTDSEGKEYDFGGTQITSSSPASLKGSDDGAKRIFSLSSMLADQEVSPSSEEQSEHYKKKATLYDTQAPVCPICQILLRPSEMQEHMAQEMERLTQLHLSKISVHKKNMAPGISKGLRTFSVQVKHEGDSPLSCPLSSEDVHQSDRYQTFLRVRTNRQTRLNARIGKMKRRKPEDGQKDGICGGEEETLELYGDNGTHVEEYEWCGLKRVRMATRLERAYRGSVFVTCSTKENHDSDADLDVDGDDTLEYGKAQYTDADIISCSTNEPGELREQDTLRGSLLNASTPPSRITSEFSKRASDEVPSTSNGEGGKLDPCTVTTQETCKHSETQSPEDSARTTLEALKARIRDLEKQLSRGDRYKCLICMDCYTVPLTSIQCWHVHCEECWLRTLGAKKLCPQCNTITSPGDLRRVYLCST